MMHMTYLKSILVLCGATLLAIELQAAPQISPTIVSGTDDIIYSENFESGTGGWSGLDLTDPGVIWHEESYNAISGDSCWWSGDPDLMGYGDNWLQYLVSPEIDLSVATNPVLSCILYWSVEDTGIIGGYDGRDGCNVWVFNSDPLVNDWEVLTPDYPAYTCQNLRSFGWRWGMGSGIPGWAGFSGGWIQASFDLTGYTRSDVRLRFAFASDELNSTTTIPSLLGFFVDAIDVREGSTVYLRNNAEGNSYPAEFTFETGPVSGDHWVFTDENFHSFSHSWNCDDLNLLSNALISPPITIPAGMNCEMRYWVYCDMPDFDGDGDDILEDYYFIEVASLGSAIWLPLVYDWAHNGSQIQWVERTNGYRGEAGLPTSNINLTHWAGQTVRIRFRAITDDNDDGGSGSGLFIDDVEIMAEFLPENDAGATRLIVPFPTYAGQGAIDCRVDLVNYGTLNQPQVPAFWSVGGSPTALFPWVQINALDTVTTIFQWTPPAAGTYEFTAYTQLSTDENPANDLADAGTVEVTPPGIFELGYDHRQVTYLLPGYFPFNYSQNNGALMYFTPADDGILGDLYSQTLKAMFFSAGTFDLHIYAPGTPSSPGAEVYSQTVTIDAGNLAPNWAEVDISDCDSLQGGHPDFWVWLEVTSNNSTPHITGHIQDCFTSGHFFTYDGSEAVGSLANYNVRVIFSGSVSVVPQEQPTIPRTMDLIQVHPNPFNSATTITFTMTAPTQATLTVYDLFGRRVETLTNEWYDAGNHQLRWLPSGVPSGSYWLHLQANNTKIATKVTLLK
jgi:hypothetical protein